MKTVIDILFESLYSNKQKISEYDGRKKWPVNYLELMVCAVWRIFIR